MSNVIDLFPQALKEIEFFWSCSKCLEEVKHLPDQSPSEYARLNIGPTKNGIQIWCVRHDCNVANLDLNELKTL